MAPLGILLFGVSTHGFGLTISALLQGPSTLRNAAIRSDPKPTSVGAAAAGFAIPQFGARCLVAVVDLVAWAMTMIFAGIGWLLFFYPLQQATKMALHLFVW
jgi:hypothetical protein